MTVSQPLEHQVSKVFAPVIMDNGGRRRMADRRRYTSRSHFPERRAMRFRRSDEDRRKNRAPAGPTDERRLSLNASFRIVA
jgi:hypothetical protein